MVKVKNLQLALQLAGKQHRYQYGLIFILCILFFQVNFILFSSSYIFMNPTFICSSNNNTIINQHQACEFIEQCQIIQHFTLTAKMKLYCKKQFERVSYQTMFSIGSLIGLICMNIIADTKGRRISVILSLILANIGCILNIFGGINQNSFLLILSQLLLGFGGYSLFVLSCILLTDFCEDSLRQKGIILINAAAGTSLVVLGSYYLYQVSWLRFLSSFIFLPLLSILIIIYFLLQQTPYILMLHNHKQKCLQMLTRLCKYNCLQHNINQIQMLIFRKQSIPIIDQRPYLLKILQIVRKWNNLKIILLVGLIYAIGNIMYFGIEFTFQDQGYNYGINSIIIGSVEMVSFVFLHYYLTRMSRTRGIAVFFGLTAFIGLMFTIPVIHQSKIYSVIMIGLSRIFFTVGYTLIVCLQTESFSVQIQSIAAGVIQSISLLGVITAPGLVVMSMSLGFNPMVVLSLLLVVGIVPNLFVQQTNKNALNSLFSSDKKDKEQTQELISVYSET